MRLAAIQLKHPQAYLFDLGMLALFLHHLDEKESPQLLCKKRPRRVPSRFRDVTLAQWVSMLCSERLLLFPHDCSRCSATIRFARASAWCCLSGMHESNLPAQDGESQLALVRFMPAHPRAREEKKDSGWFRP
jgi:hypothetical protein